MTGILATEAIAEILSEEQELRTFLHQLAMHQGTFNEL